MTGVYDHTLVLMRCARACASLTQVQLHLAVMAAVKEKEAANKLYKASEYVRSK